jgi:hypothetical protein
VIATFVAIIDLAVLAGTPLDVYNHNWGTATYELAAGVAMTLALVWLRRGHVRRVGHIMTALFVLANIGGALDKGGLIAAEIAWQCAAIVVAVLVVGPRGALAWTLVACAGLAMQLGSFDARPWAGKAVALARPADYVLEVAALYP